jgi:glycogen debranching enzyme
VSALQSAPVRRAADGSYTVPDDRVMSGASLGNGSAWIVGKSTGALQKMYALKVDEDVFWSTVVTYGSARHRVLAGLDPGDRSPEERLGLPGGHVILSPVAPGGFEFHPGHQRHTFELPDSVSVIETIFVPRTGFDDPAVAFFVIDLHNGGSDERDLVVCAYAKLAGTTPKDIEARYDAQLPGLVARNRSKPDWVRVLGATVAPSGYQTMEHAAEAYDPQNVPPLSCDTSTTGDITGALSLSVKLPPEATTRIAFVQAFSEHGEEAARAIFSSACDVEGQLRSTEQWYARMAAPAKVLTPVQTINDGAYWAKINMLRVLARYPQGLGFTNSPGASAAVVGRDLSWFTIGCDYLAPELSRDLLLRFAQTQDASGKFPEYYHAVTGATQDYGLNVNDDTPLFILGCAHHHRVTADVEFLKTIWPVVTKAADYLLSQRDDRGLVICTATGEEVFGIAGWRNIIPRFTMNGAITEINAECYAALATVASLAQCMAELEPKYRELHEQAGAAYQSYADALRDAINTHLLNPHNGMYLLNEDLNGNDHPDVTGDEVFPVMFNVAPVAVAYRIISRLNTPDFQTEAGLRTVSRLSPDYTPYRDVGLIGGVWPGLSFWYAFAAAKIYPDAMARNLATSFSHYLLDPKIYNTVPGQFSEWFDGESLVNRGMRLSPWEPPRYLWAAIEGACGLTPIDVPRRVKVAPLMPSGWRWLGLSRLMVHGRQLSYFVIRDRDRFRVYATTELEVEGDLEVYEEDVSERVRGADPDVVVLALRRGHELLVCIGSTLGVAYTFPLSLTRMLDDDRTYLVRLFNPNLGRWVEGESAAARELGEIALRLEANSFALARLTPAP